MTRFGPISRDARGWYSSMIGTARTRINTSRFRSNNWRDKAGRTTEWGGRPGDHKDAIQTGGSSRPEHSANHPEEFPTRPRPIRGHLIHRFQAQFSRALSPKRHGDKT